jgi:hypothetical protein
MTCTRKFKRDDHPREHLKKDHKCADLSKVEAGRQPLDPKPPFNRQCGFCGQMTRDRLDRIDHIAEHFKNGKRMSEWRNPWPEDVLRKDPIRATTTKMMGIQTKKITTIRRQTSKVIHGQIPEKITGMMATQTLKTDATRALGENTSGLAALA